MIKVVTVVFNENSKYYLQIFSDECLNKLQTPTRMQKQQRYDEETKT